MNDAKIRWRIRSSSLRRQHRNEENLIERSRRRSSFGKGQKIEYFKRLKQTYESIHQEVDPLIAKKIKAEEHAITVKKNGRPLSKKKHIDGEYFHLSLDNGKVPKVWGAMLYNGGPREVRRFIQKTDLSLLNARFEPGWRPSYQVKN